jgi:hypothetical protein
MAPKISGIVFYQAKLKQDGTSSYYNGLTVEEAVMGVINEHSHKSCGGLAEACDFDLSVEEIKLRDAKTRKSYKLVR